MSSLTLLYELAEQGREGVRYGGGTDAEELDEQMRGWDRNGLDGRGTGRLETRVLHCRSQWQRIVRVQLVRLDGAAERRSKKSKPCGLFLARPPPAPSTCLAAHLP